MYLSVAGLRGTGLAEAKKEDSPDIDTCTSQPLVLNDHGLGTELRARHAGGGKASTAAADDEVVGLLADGSHD